MATIHPAIVNYVIIKTGSFFYHVSSSWRNLYWLLELVT